MKPGSIEIPIAITVTRKEEPKMGQNYCICGCDSKYERSHIEQYLKGSDQMIDDPVEREGFKSGIRSALQELDMMLPDQKIEDEIDRNELDLMEKVPLVYGGALYADKSFTAQGWEYAQMLSDRDKDQNLFGMLVGDQKYKFKVEAWKGDWNSCPPEEEPTELKVTRAMSWMLTDWNNDEDGGYGLLVSSMFETPSGKPYTFNVVIPKDELIKALATLVRD